MTKQMGLISYLFYGLFIMHLSQHKTNNWPADNFKNELYTWAHDTVGWHCSADAIFDSYQLSITWISIRMATTCLGHLVNNTWSLQENSQSECTYSAVEISYGIPRTLLKISQSQHCNLFWAVHTHGTYDPLRFPTLQINEDSVILGTTVINQSVVAMPSSEWVHQLLQ